MIAEQQDAIIIPISKGAKVIVCRCHYALVAKHKWHLTEGGYARRGGSENGKERGFWMHRVINNTPEGMLTDHINHNRLDNRCINLRAATMAENAQNRNLGSDNKSGYRGVYWKKDMKRWAAKITANGKTYNLGYFATVEEAASVRKEAEIKLFSPVLAELTRPGEDGNHAA